MTTPMGFFDLIEAFPRDGCAVCRLAAGDVERHIDMLFHEGINDPGITDIFRAGRGLCGAHSWQMVAHPAAHALGVSVLFEGALDETLRVLADTPPRTPFSTGGAALAKRLDAERACLLCEKRAESDLRYAQILADFLGDERLRRAYAASDGLCLPHLRLLLRQRSPHHGFVIETQRRLWARLQAELHEFIRKNNLEYADEIITHAEGTSRLRAIARLVGEKNARG